MPKVSRINTLAYTFEVVQEPLVKADSSSEAFGTESQTTTHCAPLQRLVKKPRVAFASSVAVKSFANTFVDLSIAQTLED